MGSSLFWGSLFGVPNIVGHLYKKRILKGTLILENYPNP